MCECKNSGPIVQRPPKPPIPPVPESVLRATVFRTAWDVVRGAGTPGDMQRVSDLEHALEAHAKAHPPKVWKKDEESDAYCAKCRESPTHIDAHCVGCTMEPPPDETTTQGGAESMHIHCPELTRAIGAAWDLVRLLKLSTDDLANIQLHTTLHEALRRYGCVQVANLIPSKTTKGPTELHENPCPICGALPGLHRFVDPPYRGSGEWYCLRCSQCGRRGVNKTSSQEAIEAWKRGDVFLKGEVPRPTVGIDPGAPNPHPTILQLEKGDVCVVAVPGAFPQDGALAVYDRWKEWLPGAKIVLVEQLVQVLRPAKGGGDDG